jgi:multidrug resistance efflux pump
MAREYIPAHNLQKSLLMLFILALPITLTSCRPDTATREVTVTSGNLEVWTPCTGTMDARRTETIFSRFQGRATVVEIIPNGTEVREGDVLLRFDSSDIENDLVKLNNDLARSRAELEALEKADIPIERADIEARLGELRALAIAEQQALVDTRELVDRNLLARRELEQQESRVAVSKAKADQLESQHTLTLEHLHPARLARARSACNAAQRQYDAACRQLSNAVIRAPAAGLAVHLPVPVGTEYRTLRVGDSVFPNQPLLCIPDLREFVAQTFISEADLARVPPTAPAIITPLAYPSLRLQGAVENVSATAQSRPGYPSWQKYFLVTLRIGQADSRLRPGMSVAIDIQSHTRTNAVLLPRQAVQWENGLPACKVRTFRRTESRTLDLGIGNETSFEVLGGVKPGERILLP